MEENEQIQEQEDQGGGMIESIINMVIGYIEKAITKRAKQSNVPEKDIQIKITGDEEATPQYCFMVKFIAEDNISFSEILGYKYFDPLQREALFSPFLQKSLVYISVKENIELLSINLIVIKTEKGQITLALYNGKKFVKYINVGYIVNALDEYDKIIK